MTLPKLSLSPLLSNYVYSDKQGIKSIYLIGGNPRQRKDLLNPYFDVNCSFVLSASEYDDLMIFYRNTIKSGALPFRIDLKTDYSDIQEHQAFLSGGLRLTKTNNVNYYVSAKLQVKPIERNEIADNDFVLLYENYSSTIEDIMISLEGLVNVTLPSAL